jgi:hypothetical protein
VQPYDAGLKRYYTGFPGDNALMQSGLDIIKERAKKEDIKLLMSKPSHEVQARKTEVGQIEDMFENLRKSCDKSVINIFVFGAPTCGKTQLAKQYGEQYYETQKQHKKKITYTKQNTIVGSLDVRNESSLWRSYSRLATDLHCKVVPDGQLKDRLAILKARVQMKLRDNPDWLLIIDGVNDESKCLCIIHVVVEY